MQLVSNIGALLKALLVSIGKLLHLLLIKLYLLIPAAYVLAIWIASLCVPFRMGDYAAYVIVGTSLCIALSALLLLRKYLLGGKKSDKRAKSYVSATTVTTQNDVPPTEEQNENARNDGLDARADTDESATQTPTEQAAPAPAETPRFYRTRKDPSLFVAEYSDRLEFFRRAPDGTYSCVSVEPKQ